MATRLGLLADVHANVRALEAALRACDDAGVDRLVFLGDAIDIGPRPKEVIELLLSRSQLLCIRGNHDEWYASVSPADRPDNPGPDQLAHEEWTTEAIGPSFREAVGAWPLSYEETLEGTSVQYLHYQMTARAVWADPTFAKDAPTLDTQFQPRADVLCYGHDHHALDVTGKCRYLNPGAVGTGHDSCARFAIVDFAGARVSVSMQTVDYDRDAVLRDLEARDVPDRETIRRLFFGVS